MRSVSTDYSSSMYQYLFAIFLLGKDAKKVISVDIARRLDVSKASVSVALKKLKSSELTYMEGTSIKFTEYGLRIVKILNDRYVSLFKLFTRMDMDEDVAEKEAFRLSFQISPEAHESIDSYFSNMPAEVSLDRCS